MAAAEGEIPTSSTAELLAALCYALLHSFDAGAGAVTVAPTLAVAEREAVFASEELDRYRVLRRRLDELTSDPDRALRPFRAPLDAFYRAVRVDSWLEAQVFRYVGDTITRDFAELLAVRIDHRSAEAVRSALTGRTEREASARGEILLALEREGEPTRERIASFARTMVAAGLNRFRDALLASDSLEHVVGGPDPVKEIVIELLARYRERLERLGLDTVE